MKRIEFYTLINNFGEPAAVKVKGYTDGNYNYYKDKFNNWHCVIPSLGIAFHGYFTKRYQAVEDGYKEENVTALNKYYINNEYLINRFKELVEKAMEEK